MHAYALTVLYKSVKSQDCGKQSRELGVYAHIWDDFRNTYKDLYGAFPVLNSKNRDGSLGKFTLLWQPCLARLRDLRIFAASVLAKG